MRLIDCIYIKLNALTIESDNIWWVSNCLVFCQNAFHTSLIDSLSLCHSSVLQFIHSKTQSRCKQKGHPSTTKMKTHCNLLRLPDWWIQTTATSTVSYWLWKQQLRKQSLLHKVQLLAVLELLTVSHFLHHRVAKNCSSFFSETLIHIWLKAPAAATKWTLCLNFFPPLMFSSAVKVWFVWVIFVNRAV